MVDGMDLRASYTFLFFLFFCFLPNGFMGVLIAHMNVQSICSGRVGGEVSYSSYFPESGRKGASTCIIRRSLNVIAFHD